MREQTLYARIQTFRQVVAGQHAHGREHELALGRRVRVDLRMSLQTEPLTHTEIAHAAFALKTLGLQVVARHRQLPQLAMVVVAGAGQRHFHDVVVQAGRQAIAVTALVRLAARLGAHELRAVRVAVIPAVALRLSGLQATHGIPGRDRVALFGGVIAVIAHRAGRVLRQAAGVVEQQQSMHGHVGGVRAGGRSRLETPGDAAAPEQAADKGGIGFIMLHREFAHGQAARRQRRIDGEIQAGGEHAIALPPLLKQELHDLQCVLVAKHPRIDAFFHQGQTIAQHQLIGRQATIALPRARFGDDAADPAQLPPVGDDLQFGWHGDELFQRQLRLGGHAQDAVLNPAADGLAAADALRQQDILIDTFRISEAQPQSTLVGGQGLVHGQPLREVFHGFLPSNSQRGPSIRRSQAEPSNRMS